MKKKKIIVKTRDTLHWIGLVFINTNISKKPDLNLNQINITNILLNPKNHFPTIKIEYTKDFKFKKYIRQYLLDEYELKKKNIEDIRFIDSYKKIHSYMILIKKTKYIDKGYCITNLSYNSDLFGWKPIINFYKYMNNHERKFVYKYLYDNYMNSRIPNYKFYSSEVYRNQYFINFYKIILLISNLENI